MMVKALKFKPEAKKQNVELERDESLELKPWGWRLGAWRPRAGVLGCCGPGNRDLELGAWCWRGPVLEAWEWGLESADV